MPLAEILFLDLAEFCDPEKDSGLRLTAFGHRPVRSPEFPSTLARIGVPLATLTQFTHPTRLDANDCHWIRCDRWLDVRLAGRAGGRRSEETGEVGCGSLDERWSGDHRPLGFEIGARERWAVPGDRNNESGTDDRRTLAEAGEARQRTVAHPFDVHEGRGSRPRDVSAPHRVHASRRDSVPGGRRSLGKGAWFGIQ